MAVIALLLFLSLSSLSSASKPQSFHCGSLITSKVRELCRAPFPLCLSSNHQDQIKLKFLFGDTKDLNLYPAGSIFNTSFSPLGDCFMGFVVLAPTQGLQTWLCAAVYEVSFFLAARGRDWPAHFYKCFS